MVKGRVIKFQQRSSCGKFLNGTKKNPNGSELRLIKIKRQIFKQKSAPCSRISPLFFGEIVGRGGFND